MKPVYAWHFVGDKLRDGKPVPKDGVKLIHKGLVIPCQQGLHASVDPYDALKYAPGGTLCLVRCEGEIKYDAGDKLACSERTIIARIDAEKLLRAFARKCALDVIHLWDAPKVVADYLRTGDGSLRDAARAAAWAATQTATWAAAQDAARAAAWAAAPGSSSRAAAQTAAWAAAWAAARDATEKKQRANFKEMVDSEFSKFLENLD